MVIFDEIIEKGHEQIVFCSDKSTGLKAIIAIHNTYLGPALGGCRMYPYANEQQALEDVLRLSRGMTYKSAVAGLNLGGGKAVIIGDSKTMKSEALFRSFGRFVQSLGGLYITAEDVGTSVQDMEWVRMETDFVTGTSTSVGGSGDPSLVTAYGVFHGLRGALHFATGSDSLKDRVVAIQGLGQVGFHLIEHLVSAGARVVGSDIDAEKVRRAVTTYPSLKLVEPESIFDVACDIFAPCALGAVLNDQTIPRLKCKIVAGSANNMLAQEERHAKQLEQLGILYVPDYVINSGGIINVYNELCGYNRKHALSQAAGIFNIVSQICDIAKKEQVSTLQAANALAERRIEKIGILKLRTLGVPLKKRG